MYKGVKLAGVGLICLLFAGCIGADISYGLLQDTTQQEDNMFQGASINIKIREYQKNKTYDAEDELVAKQFNRIGTDDFVEKKVSIFNCDASEDFPTSDAFVKVRLVPILRDQSGNNRGAIEVEYSFEENQQWVLKDGNYYYKKVLKTGETTELLVCGVKVNTKVPKDCYVQIQVLAEAVQAYPTKELLGGVDETPVYENWGVYPLEL